MRIRIASVIAATLLTAACGNTSQERMTTGGLSGAAVGALAGGPVGAIAGLGVGALLGATLDESVDRKVNEFASAYVPQHPEQASAGAPTTERSGAAERAGGTQAAGGLSVGAIHDELHGAGYDRVYDIRRDGNVYRARGVREGHTYNIVADAETGRIISSTDVRAAARRQEPTSGAATTPGMLSEQQVRDRLRRQGYSQVENVRQDGDNFDAQARWGNQRYDVKVDGHTGRVMSSQPSSNQSSIEVPASIADAQAPGAVQTPGAGVQAE